MFKRSWLFCLFFVILFLASPLFAKRAPYWVKDFPIPEGQSLFLVSKGLYPSQAQAKKTQAFIAQLMGSVPPDQVDLSDHYEGLPKGRYVIGTLFDSRARANWWIEFSYRNRKLPKGTIVPVRKKGPSQLIYYPEASRHGPEALIDESRAIALVKSLPDVQKLQKNLGSALRFEVIDYPRTYDLRYEIKMSKKVPGRRDPVMLDFFMVSAQPGVKNPITERFSRSMHLYRR
ncbi:MAG: hypothetical protein KDK66_04685 [Deltaproteobacteria bacterium]|nr:hypothetical protein [Deltaproteobacteria bacterium]